MKKKEYLQAVAASMILVSAASSLAKEPTEADYKAYLEYLVGDWKVESQGLSGAITFTLSPTKRCLTSHAVIDGGPQYHAIEGYDAEKKCWKRLLFWGHGGHAIAHTRIVSGQQEASLDGLTLEGDVHDVQAGGSSRDSKVVYKVLDKNKWEVRREEASIYFTRVPEKQTKH